MNKPTAEERTQMEGLMQKVRQKEISVIEASQTILRNREKYAQNEVKKLKLELVDTQNQYLKLLEAQNEVERATSWITTNPPKAGVYIGLTREYEFRSAKWDGNIWHSPDYDNQIIAWIPIPNPFKPPIKDDQDEKSIKHVCGTQGFNPMLGDNCPACDNERNNL